MTEQSALVDQIVDRCKDALFTGILRVRSGPGDGELWFLSGIVEQVRFGVSSGDEAMDRLRKLTDARVEVLPRLPTEAGSFKKGHPLEGSLSEHLPVELFNFCETQALTCTVELASGKGVRGSASYKLGELISIHTDVGTDRAVAEMLEWNEGTFKFVLPNVELPEGVTRAPDSTGTPASASTPPPARTAIADDEARVRRERAESKRRAEDVADRQRVEREAARKTEEGAQRDHARRKAEEETARRKSDDERAARAKADEEAARRKVEQRREEPKRKASPVISDAPPRAVASSPPAARAGAASNPPRGVASNPPAARAGVASDPPKAAAASTSTRPPADGPKRMDEGERRRAAEGLKRKAEEVMRRKTADTDARKGPPALPPPDAATTAKAFFADSLEPRKAPASVRPEAAADEAPAKAAADASAEAEAAARRAEAEIAAQKDAAEAVAKAKKAAAEAERNLEKAKPASGEAAAAPDEDEEVDSVRGGKKRRRRKSRAGESGPPSPRASVPSLPVVDAKKGMPPWVWLAVAALAAVFIYLFAFRR